MVFAATNSLSESQKSSIRAVARTIEESSDEIDDVTVNFDVVSATQ